MAKLEDYNFSKQPSEVIAFKEDIEGLVNFGKFQFQVVSVPPTFAGNPGEITVYRNGTDGRLYIYLGSSWNVAVLFTSDAS